MILFKAADKKLAEIGMMSIDDQRRLRVSGGLEELKDMEDEK